MTTGQKHDQGKRRKSLLPPNTVNQVIDVLEFGARKYAENNWRYVPDASTRYYDAADRHIEAWWRGEKTDPETGLSHLAHATCCLLFLIWLDDNTPDEPGEVEVVAYPTTPRERRTGSDRRTHDRRHHSG